MLSWSNIFQQVSIMKISWHFFLRCHFFQICIVPFLPGAFFSGCHFFRCHFFLHPTVSAVCSNLWNSCSILQCGTEQNTSCHVSILLSIHTCVYIFHLLLDPAHPAINHPTSLVHPLHFYPFVSPPHPHLTIPVSVEFSLLEWLQVYFKCVLRYVMCMLFLYLKIIFECFYFNFIVILQ